MPLSLKKNEVTLYSSLANVVSSIVSCKSIILRQSQGEDELLNLRV